ncbi:hypothetical protein [Actinoplanes sp. NPDC049599]|uniref:hypothetical protein n=1 Tax=Actinoplanes sp. NPDC049599 TaxID=3363903 RepID=UPI003795280D
MRHRSIVLAASLLAALTTTGCEPPGTREPAATDWRKVADRDLNCPGGAAEVFGGVDEYDIDQDRILDQFVTMRCRTAAGSPAAPGQLEVFKGGTAPDNPTRLAVIVHHGQNLRLTGCVTFAGLEAFTRGANGETTAVWGAHWVAAGKKKRLAGYEYRNPGQLAGCDPRR